MDNKYLELIHNEIDQTNTPEARVELEAFLAENPEAQALYNELVALTGMLDKVEAQEPPPHLKQAILKALAEHTYTKAQPGKRFGLLGTLIEALQARPRFAYAYVFSVGLIVGLVAYALVANLTQPASMDLYGTLVSKDGARNLEAVAEAAIDLDGVHGTVQVKTSAGLVVVELALDMRKQIEVRLAFDENALRLRSLTRQEDRSGHTLTTEDNHMSITWLGEDTYVLVFNDRAASSTDIHLQLLHADDVLYERSLATRAR